MADNMGKFEKAVNYLNTALDIAQTNGNPALRVAALSALGDTYAKTADRAKAIDYCSRALEIGTQAENRLMAAESYSCLGLTHYFSGATDKAIEFYSKALSAWNSVGDRRNEARSLVYLGHSYSDLGVADEAAQYDRRALELFRLTGDKRGQAECLVSLANVTSKLGNKQSALTLLYEARALITGSGDAMSEGSLLIAIAIAHLGLGDDTGALDFFKLARTKFHQLGLLKGEAIALRYIGEIYYAASDFREAFADLTEALKIDQSLSDKRLEAYTRRNLGLVREALHDTEGALDEFNQALELNRAVSDRWQEAYTLASIGHVYESLGEFIRASDFYEKALIISRDTKDSFGELATLYRIAHCYRSQGRLDEAFQEMKFALAIIERLRATVASSALRSLYFATVRDYYDLQIDVLMRRYQRTKSDVLATQSFELSERAHARTLLDSIGEERLAASEAADPVFAEREKSLGALLDSRENRYTLLLSQSPGSSEVAALGDEVGKLTAEYEQIQAQIRLKDPRYASLTKPEPLTLEEIQRELANEDTLILEYSLGDENSYLWAVSENDFQSYVLPGRTVVDDKVRRIRDLMLARIPREGEKPAGYQARVRTAEARYGLEAKELSEILLGPVAAKLGNRRVAIVAEGSLQYLPFAALPDPNKSDPNVPLILDHEIVNLPSASTLALLRREKSTRKTPDRTIAVFADPVFNKNDSRLHRATTTAAVPKVISPMTNAAQVPLRGETGFANVPRLVSTRQEAEAITAMVPSESRMVALDFNATRAAAMDPELSRYRIVHFATHGIANDEHAEQSGLLLSLVDAKGTPQNGFLRLRDIYGMNLSADLVVLSACNTALGKDVKGEGLVGMVRGFMYSGTPRVLASLWTVDDAATAELMKEFYAQLLITGLKPSAALRKAQLVQMQKKSRQSPYYWAGFQLQGEWN
jgi:CHAT domain-containing protein/uncharacterized protein HemY